MEQARTRDPLRSTLVFGGEPQRSAADALVGRLLAGRYRVGEVIAAGAMGVVYAGTQERLERPVAIKVLRLEGPHRGDPTAVERFIREARAAGGLVHPNTVVVHDFGLLEDGRPYMVMERLRGVTLGALRQRSGGRLPGAEVQALLRPVADALDALHALGIVHRDVKPENVVLADTPDGARTVKLIDFGLVALADKHRLTRHGLVVGTPEYIAPECLLDSGLPGPAADVYSLAVIAFELLAGGLPYGGRNVREHLHAKVLRDARPLHAAAGVAFPPALEAVFARALARDPRRRYPSAGAFAEALAGELRALAPSVEAAHTARMEIAAQPTPQLEANVWSFESGTGLMERRALTDVLEVPGISRWREPSVVAAAAVLGLTVVGCAAVLLWHFSHG